MTVRRLGPAWRFSRNERSGRPRAVHPSRGGTRAQGHRARLWGPRVAELVGCENCVISLYDPETCKFVSQAPGFNVGRRDPEEVPLPVGRSAAGLELPDFQGARRYCSTAS